MHLGIHLGLATTVKTALWYLVGKSLADRPEVGTPFSRFDQTEEARYWIGQGRSPYASASVHAPPLLLAFSSPSTVLLADLCSSLLLWVIGRRLLASAGEATLWSHGLASCCQARARRMFTWWCRVDYCKCCRVCMELSSCPVAHVEPPGCTGGSWELPGCHQQRSSHLGAVRCHCRQSSNGCGRHSHRSLSWPASSAADGELALCCVIMSSKSAMLPRMRRLFSAKFRLYGCACCWMQVGTSPAPQSHTTRWVGQTCRQAHLTACDVADGRA